MNARRATLPPPLPLLVLLVLAHVAQTAPASAGDRTPVSALPKLPATHERSAPPAAGESIAGVTITPNRTGAYASIDARTKDGYCMVNRRFGLQLQETTGFEEESTELWRFRESESSLRVEMVGLGTIKEPRSLWARSRTSVEAVAIARHHGVTVWAFRDPSGDAYVVTRAAPEGQEALATDDPEGRFLFRNVFSGCSHGAVRISASLLKLGAVVQLRGDQEHPEGKFVVDVSAAKLSRDPEAMLSVRLRRTE
jgi:hypothetical protein